MPVTVTVQQMTINGVPYGCEECASRWFTLDANPRFDAYPADANCYYSHHWQDPVLTGSAVAMIAGSASRRRKANTFSVTVGGALLEGTLQPEVTADDVRQLGRVLWDLGVKSAFRSQKRAAVRAVKRPVKKAARQAADAVKSGMLRAAWTGQAGGYEDDPDYKPEPLIPCGACDGSGSFDLDTNLHGDTVPCSICRGTGDAGAA